MPNIEVGQKSTFQRTFTIEDVKSFTGISGDEGIHHMEPNENGKVMVQGLLTATLPTKLGGDLNYIARKMTFDFPRPVFVGDTITCQGTVSKVIEEKGRLRVWMSIVCINQHGKGVLLGTTEGIIRLDHGNALKV